MKRKLLFFIIIFLLIAPFITATAVTTLEQPLPGMPPTVSGPADYIIGLFISAISIVGLVAVTTIAFGGFVYLTSVMDLFSRKIIGWHLSDNLSTEGVLVAIKKAKASRNTDQPVIIHSDRGVQFVSKAYINETPAKQFVRSYSAKGTPWDNACIESFHALIKREWLNRFIIKHIKHAHDLVFEYIDTFYNTTRLHGSCDMLSPFDYEAKHAI